MNKHVKALASLIGKTLVLLLIVTLGVSIGSGQTQILISLSLLSPNTIQTLPLAFLPIMLQALSTFLLILVWVRFVEKRPLNSLGLTKGRESIAILKGWLYALLVNGSIIVSLVCSGDLRLAQVVSPDRLLVSLIFLLTATHFQGTYEEVIIRGWYFPSLSRHYGKWAGLGISSLIFGLAHLYAFQDMMPIVNIVLFGILTCLYVWEEGNLWLVIGFHSFNNFLLVSVFTLKTGFLGDSLFGLFIFENPGKTLPDGILGSWQASLIYSGLIMLMIGRRLGKTRSI